MKTVDFHIHVYSPEVIRNAESLSLREPYFNVLTHNRVHRWATLEDLLDRMERDDVERAVVGGFAFRDLGLCKLCNDYIIEGVRKHPDKLSDLCLINKKISTTNTVLCAAASLISLDACIARLSI